MGLLAAWGPAAGGGEAPLAGVYALLGLGLVLMALCLVHWLWMWEALRAGLVVMAAWLPLAGLAGPDTHLLPAVRIILAAQLLMVAFLMGQVDLRPWYAAQMARGRAGREVALWSEGRALQVAGVLLGLIVVGALTVPTAAQTGGAGLAVGGLAALALWMRGCARYAASKGYAEWVGLAASPFGPAGFLLLACTPLRSESPRAEQTTADLLSARHAVEAAQGQALAAGMPHR